MKKILSIGVLAFFVHEDCGATIINNLEPTQTNSTIARCVFENVSERVSAEKNAHAKTIQELVSMRQRLVDMQKQLVDKEKLVEKQSQQLSTIEQQLADQEDFNEEQSLQLFSMKFDLNSAEMQLSMALQKSERSGKSEWTPLALQHSRMDQDLCNLERQHKSELHIRKKNEEDLQSTQSALEYVKDMILGMQDECKEAEERANRVAQEREAVRQELNNVMQDLAVARKWSASPLNKASKEQLEAYEGLKNACCQKLLEIHGHTEHFVKLSNFLGYWPAMTFDQFLAFCENPSGMLYEKAVEEARRLNGDAKKEDFKDERGHVIVPKQIYRDAARVFHTDRGGCNSIIEAFVLPIIKKINELTVCFMCQREEHYKKGRK